MQACILDPIPESLPQLLHCCIGRRGFLINAAALLEPGIAPSSRECRWSTVARVVIGLEQFGFGMCFPAMGKGVSRGHTGGVLTLTVDADSQQLLAWQLRPKDSALGAPDRKLY